MNQSLSGRRILVFVGDIYEDLELWYPRLRLIEAGAEVVVAGPVFGETYAGKNGYPCVADAAIGDMSAVDFDGLVVPRAPRAATAAGSRSRPACTTGCG